MTAALKIVADESWHTLYLISVYNTDDVLTQGKWSAFQQDIKRILVSEDSVLIHGLWYTSPALDYQSMCIGFNLTGEFPEMTVRVLKGCLKGLSEEYPGCTIQWAVATVDYI
jgi:hypothetical protein